MAHTNYRLSINVIDRGIRVLEDSGYGAESTKLGGLMRADGVTPDQFRGSAPYIHDRLRDRRAARDDAQRRLAISLREVRAANDNREACGG